MSDALIQRWQGFIAKILDRLQEIMTESEQGMLGLFAAHPNDFLPITNAMSGLDARVRVLKDKLQETWDAQVHDKFIEAGIQDTGLDMKADAEQQLDWTWTEWKARITGDFYRRLEPAARAAAAQPVQCSQCGMQLARQSYAEVVAVTCPGCGAVNQISPSKDMFTYYGGMPMAFADEQTVALRREIEAFRAGCDRWRRDRNWAPEPLEHYERWEQMERNFWVTHTKIRCQLAGKPFDQALVDARMQQFIKWSLECEQVWVRAKGRMG
jgi:phage FluMu protein Com